MMIDWISAKIPLSHNEHIIGGKFFSIDQDGVVEFESNKFLQVEGSHSSKISIKSLHTGEDGELYFSGNPAKFLQGHNLFGSNDILAIMSATIERIYSVLGIQPTTQNLTDVKNGNYQLTRLDITEMFELPTKSDVLAWIRACAHSSRSRHKSAGVLRGDTLYWGQNSRSWSMKAYAKGQEILAKGHELAENLLFRAELTQWAENKLRLELTLRGTELKKHGMQSACSFNDSELFDKFFRMYRERITVSENFSLSSELIEILPQNLRCSYVLWKNGEDLRQTLSKNTYYRHRRELLKHGVDISVKQLPESSNVIPLVRVLEAIPAKIPAFAIGTPLYWQVGK